MAELRLPSGHIAHIDDADMPIIAGHRWQAFKQKSGLVYVASYERSGGKMHWTLLHRLLMPDVPRIDHINGNGLDNRRANLRQATHTQNMQNRKRSKSNRSGFKGVYWAAYNG